MTERYNTEARASSDGSGEVTTSGVGGGSGQSGVDQANNSFVGFEFPIKWDDLSDSLTKLNDAKKLNQYLDDMALRDNLLEDFLNTNIVNAIIGDTSIKTTQASGVVSLSLYTDLLKKLCPVGSIHPYPGTVAPSGWLLCNGSLTTLYPELAALVGSTTPNLRGKVIVGYNTGEAEFDTMFETGGVKSVTLTAAQSGMPAHKHTFQSSSYALQPVRFSTDANEYVFSGYGTADTSTVSAVDASSAHTNLQPYMTLNYIIKHDYI